MKAHYDDVSVMDNPGRFTVLIKNNKLVYSYDTEELLGNIDPYDFDYEEVLWNIRFQWGLLVSSLSLEKNISREALKRIERDFLVRSYFAKTSIRFYKEMMYRLSLIDMKFDLDDSIKKVNKLSRMIRSEKISSPNNALRDEINFEVFLKESQYKIQKNKNTYHSLEVLERENEVETKFNHIQRKLEYTDDLFNMVEAPL